MSLPAADLRRPVTTVAATLALVLLGAVSLSRLVAAGDTVLVEGHLTLTHDAPVRLVLRAAPAATP